MRAAKAGLIRASRFIILASVPMKIRSRSFSIASTIIEAALAGSVVGILLAAAEVQDQAIATPEFIAISVLIAPGYTSVTRTFVPRNSERRPSLN